MSKNKSICFFTVSHPMYGLGGAEIHSLTLAQNLVEEGWEVFFLSKKGNSKNNYFNDQGVKLIFYEKSRHIFLWLKIFSIIKKNRFDIVFYRNNQYVIGILAILSKLFDYKLIWSIKHDQFCGKDAATKKDKMKKKINFFRAFVHNLKDVLFIYGVRNASNIIVQNSYQEQIIKKDFNIVPLKMYSSTKIDALNEKRENIILFIATMKDFKRPHIFCDIAKSLNNYPYRFIMIGSNFGNKSKANKLLKKIQMSGVEYIGEQSLDKVRYYLNKAKLLINTSTYEGFPNTFVQAFAHGVPVVSIDVNPDNIITDFNLGRYLDGDENRAINAIIQILDSKELHVKYSLNCYKYALDNLNIEKNIKDLVKVF